MLDSVTPGYNLPVTTEAIEIEAGKSKVHGDVNFACDEDAGEDGCTVTVNAEGVATYTGGKVTATNSTAYAARLNPRRDPTDNAAANLIAAAISDYSYGIATAGGVTPSVSRFGGDAQITVTHASKNFAPDTVDPALSAVTGWMGQAFSYSTETPATEERVVVYTNKGQAEDVNWNVLQNGRRAIEENGFEKTIIGDLSANPQEGINTGHFGGAFQLPPDSPGGTASRVITIPAGGADQEEKGTFYGVSGTFICSGDANDTCVIQRAGGLIAKSGDGAFTFKPDEDDADELPKLKAKYATQDTDYATFGYWSRAATEDDKPKVTIETFATAEGNLPGDSVLPNVHGSATYNGAAAGLFARFDGNNTFAGEFTATASLTADFGGAAIDPDDRYKIKGMISNFRGDGVDSTWALELKEVDFAARDTTNPNAAANNVLETGELANFTGSTSGGGANGDWRASFSGTDSAEGNRPTNIAGEFNGNFRNGQVAGAFGASHQ
ncbi:MAG: hypothetical protein OXE83_15780 [Gammaproteobacteria bacterium]|nr:hypothetical protein [Gammaproteobacteria bacterium]